MIFATPDGATPLHEDEKEGLKLPHIFTRGELNRWEQQNILEAYNWLERRRRSEMLDEQFVRKLHEQMFGKVWLWAGSYRQSNKNIGVDWTRIPMELRNLLEDVRLWIDQHVFEPDEIAVRYHHRLVAVHCFPNGNGRHARLITDYLLEVKFNKEPFTWGSVNLNNPSETRSIYIAALREADRMNYTPLLDFVRS